MSGAQQHRLDPALIDRFARDLDALIDRHDRIGLAVSGGPDSIALLLLAASARPEHVEVATVDHQLRGESADEAALVASVCASVGVPHRTLALDWENKPATAIQERARAGRYALLSDWAGERGLAAIVTAHHSDDQAETFLMRLARGAGVGGLAAMRPLAVVPGSETPLVRPLLGWSRAELAGACAAAGIAPVNDPSNQDERFERVRVRNALATTSWLDPGAIAASAANLAQADEALAWATETEWKRCVEVLGDAITYKPIDAPAEIRRRILLRAIAAVATEGEANPLRGAETARLLATLREGGTATARGVLCTGGSEWRFSRAPARRT